MIRKAVFSGQFYPEASRDITKFIESLGYSRSLKISAKGIILPHAGYVYSGKVAVSAASKIAGRKTVLALGPNHTGLGSEFSLWAKGAWETPCGDIAIDEGLAKAILAKNGPITEDYSAHTKEHSIEVQLPILKYFLGGFSLVPIACGLAVPGRYKEAAWQIFEAIKELKSDVLLLASTDLTHYEPDSIARKKDSAVIEAIVNLDEKKLLDNVKTMNITMCGLAPVAILISCLKLLGARKATVAMYQTSGDALGDYDSVVGYAGIIIK
ncbi:MAG: AmmeMemoRadiSam system protein B [Candidatus Omnitrophica bacterium]|nr:AmmeMemoRadiSam system protein B [Candidatus Omnitrophota bacterium]MDD5429752.1 AmmeMemoRadiSam system protein B [Candidatus Omnitrophota bacterium]